MGGPTQTLSIKVRGLGGLAGPGPAEVLGLLAQGRPARPLWQTFTSIVSRASCFLQGGRRSSDIHVKVHSFPYTRDTRAQEDPHLLLSNGEGAESGVEGPKRSFDNIFAWATQELAWKHCVAFPVLQPFG